MMLWRYFIILASYCFFQTALAQNYAQCRNLQGQSYDYCMDAVSKGLNPLAPPTSAGKPPQKISPPSVVTAPAQQTPPQVRTAPPAVAPPQVSTPVVNYGQPPSVAPPSRNTYQPPTVKAPINNQGVARPPQVSAPVQQYNCQTSSGIFAIKGTADYAQAKCNELNAKPAQSSQPTEKIYVCGGTNRQVRAIDNEVANSLCNQGATPRLYPPIQNTQISFRCSGNVADKVVQAENAEKATLLCSQLASQGQPTDSRLPIYTPPVLNAPQQQFTCQTATGLRPFSATSSVDARAKCDALVLQDAKPSVAPPANQQTVSTPTAPRVELPNIGVATNSVPSVSKPHVAPPPSQTTHTPPEEKLTQQRFDCPVKVGSFIVSAANEEGARARCNVLRAEHGQPTSSLSANQSAVSAPIATPRVEQPTVGIATKVAPPVTKPYVVSEPINTGSTTTVPRSLEPKIEAPIPATQNQPAFASPPNSNAEVTPPVTTRPSTSSSNSPTNQTTTTSSFSYDDVLTVTEMTWNNSLPYQHRATTQFQPWQIADLKKDGRWSEWVAHTKASVIGSMNKQTNIASTPSTKDTRSSAQTIVNPVFKYDCYEFQGQATLGRPYKDVEKKFITDCAENIATNLIALQKTDEEIKQKLHAANIVFLTDVAAGAIVGTILFSRVIKPIDIVSGLKNFTIDPNKFNYFFGKVTSLENGTRSAQTLADLTKLGITTESQLFNIFNQALNNPVIKTITNSYGVTVVRAVELVGRGKIEVSFFYEAGNLLKIPSISTIIVKIFQ